MFNGKKGNAQSTEEVQVQDTELITEVDDNIMEVDEDFGDFGAMGVIFNAEDDVAYIDDESFSGIIDDDGTFEVETGEVDEQGQKIKKRVKVKRVRRRKKDDDITIGLMRDENFGELIPYIKDINVTDINWNGRQLWIDDITKGRYRSDIVLSKDFVDTFCIRISNVVSKAFNKYSPRLEAETDELRVTVVHESVSHTGTAISIRKTPAIKRINFMEAIKNGDYCSEVVANLMSNAVKARMNILVIGLPGVGKTELVKYLTNYIFPRDRAITIEDTLEIHYADINPDKDCMELKVDDRFTYTDAIKVSLRLLPQWILLSEARSSEVKYLIEAASTGSKCITTLHADDVRKVPDRILNMIGTLVDRESVLNSIYSFFDMGILIGKKEDDKTGKIDRWIEQVCLYTRENEENKTVMLVDNSELLDFKLSKDVLRKFELAGIADPTKYTFI